MDRPLGVDCAVTVDCDVSVVGVVVLDCDALEELLKEPLDPSVELPELELDSPWNGYHPLLSSIGYHPFSSEAFTHKGMNNNAITTMTLAPMALL
ncbi:MAG: hypothetical protein PHN63_01505 [Candidatus Omnitrophica bacterium]|nr:hypothetical protein [Candidatus Omnitrophota bacterium]